MDSTIGTEKWDVGKDGQIFDLLRPRHDLSITLPSQGTENPHDPLHLEKEHAYEHRHLLMSTTSDNRSGILVTRKPYPEAERAYFTEVFSKIGLTIPEIITANFSPENWNVPLDQIIFADRAKLKELMSAVNRLEAIHGERPKLQVFNPTSYSERIAQELGIKLMANREFAEWAGTKSGLVDFLHDCNVSTPLTYKVENFSGIVRNLKCIKEAGYPQVVVKMNFSTGGMGHRVTDIDEAIAFAENHDYTELFPEGLGKVQGAAILQGWIPDSVSLSVGMYVSEDYRVDLTSTQQHILSVDPEGRSVSAVGAVPLTHQYKERLLIEVLKIGTGYVKYKAIGPHTMGMIAPTDEWCDRLGFDRGTLLAVDENTRPGSTTLALSYAVALRNGPENLGTGWAVSTVPVTQKLMFDQVLSRLQESGYLIEDPNELGEGIFPYGGLILHSGNGTRKFLAISLADNAERALEILKEVQASFREP